MGKPAATFYTADKLSRLPRVIETRGNGTLFSKGRYPTKLAPGDLPESYIEVSSRVFGATRAWVKASAAVDAVYKPMRINHMFKDDYLLISYSGEISPVVGPYGSKDYEGWDLAVSGNDIPRLVLAIEKYSGIDCSSIRSAIEEKRLWLRGNHPDAYRLAFCDPGDPDDLDEDVFANYVRRGRIDSRLLWGYARASRLFAY